MPRYEYQCSKHGTQEVSHSISAPSLTHCPNPDCDLPVQRLISRSSFELRGDGWYKDGYAKKGA